ncbi:MAG TPA: DegT/DnrJ/EryC1/StrS family aminotransferase [Solirubrobacteraceae bacterium]|nr:DegT/DnrJ/EryC1/StrS family aminotransferase [Solirubrobacteraceae bacterium]
MLNRPPQGHAAPSGQAASGGQAVPAAVPFTRLDFAEPELLEELMGAVHEIAARGAFTLGDAVETFEREFAAYCDCEQAIGVSSGTEAIALALRALEIGPGDEVIVPSNSFIATAEAVSAVGATPLLVDVDPDSHLLTAETVAQHLTPKVRCIIPVHLFGATVDLDPILALAQEAGVHVVEDACQAHGARYRGRRVGSLGVLGCFSFYPTKNLGAWGDGGAVTTSVPELAERIRLLRAHGEQPRYHHRVIGTTARLDALQAAVLSRKLARLDDWNERRRELGARLRERLHGLEQVRLTRLPFPEADHVYHLFVVRTDERDALREHLSERGVASAVHYPTPIHRTEAYSHLGLGAGSLPVCEELAERMCSLPLFPSMSDAESERVADAVASFVEDRAARRVDLSI